MNRLATWLLTLWMILGLGSVRADQRYEAQVPDTLDLAERARLAVNALTSCSDPNDY